MSRRDPGFDLVTAIADSGFTPSRRDVPALLDLLATAPAAVRERAERALRRAGPPALEAGMARAKEAPPEARARLVGLVGRMGAGDPEARAFLLDALADPAAAVRKRAADGLGRTRAEGPAPAPGGAALPGGAKAPGGKTPPVDAAARAAAPGGAQAPGEVGATASPAATPEDVGAALAAALGRETDAAARAAIIAALGKVGGDAARAALDELDALGRASRDERAAAPDRERAPAATVGPPGRPPRVEHAAAPGPEVAPAPALDARADAELRKARVRAARSAAREEGAGIDVTRPLEMATRVWLECRRGLLPVLLEEAAALQPRTAHRLDGGAVAEVRLAGPLQRLFASRLWIAAALPGEVVRAHPERRPAPPGPASPEARHERGRAARSGTPPAEQPDHAHLVARAIARGEAHDAAASVTRGPLRYRLAWAGGGKRRAEVYRVAEAAAAIDPALVNDPSDAPWQVVVRETATDIGVEWVPALADPRFAYRHGDVPAASHPTIAAALAFLAGVREEDVVWDPFVGSGLELCERALRGPYRRLAGTDVDPAALDVARANLDACGAERFDLAVHDAAAGAPRGLRPTLVITNPPMGRRVHRHADLRAFLRGFVAGVARALAPGGRFVWVSPFPADTRAAASAAGLTAVRGHVVDMGGFDAEIQVFTKDRGRAAPPAP